MRIIDFHSHILPDMDDGARDVNESIAILELLQKQGVTVVYATPHFYADMESVKEFSDRRDRAFAELSAAISHRDDLPEVRLGAEIMICKELSGLDLSPLKFADAQIMLFEYPVSRYYPWYASLAEKIAATYACCAMVAHFDRYPWLDKKTLRAFTSYGDDMLFQMNCFGLTDPRAVKNLSRILKAGSAVVFGTDSHDTDAHAPSFNIFTNALSTGKIKASVLGFSSIKADALAERVEASQEYVASLNSKNSKGLIG